MAWIAKSKHIISTWFHCTLWKWVVFPLSAHSACLANTFVVISFSIYSRYLACQNVASYNQRQMKQENQNSMVNCAFEDVLRLWKWIFLIPNFSFNYQCTIAHQFFVNFLLFFHSHNIFFISMCFGSFCSFSVSVYAVSIMELISN